MGDRMRWRYGDTNPVTSAVDADTVIAIGDVVYLEGDVCKPAEDMKFGERAAVDEMQRALAGKFLGVAMQRSRRGDTDPIRVATSGVFEFDCASMTFRLGQYIGVSPNKEVLGLDSQRVGRVADANQAIARVARRESQDATCLLIEIRSKIMYGGIVG